MRTGYSSYLNSPAWKKKKQGLLAKRPWKCFRCGRAINPRNVEIHHTKYETDLKNVNEVDLVLVCPKCHEKL